MADFCAALGFDERSVYSGTEILRRPQVTVKDVKEKNQTKLVGIFE